MGSKNKPGAFDCYANAEPDEPMFVLLGRDPAAGPRVRLWASTRAALGKTIEPSQIEEAIACADAMELWAMAKDKSAEVGRARMLLGPNSTPVADTAVAAIDASIQFAPKACMVAMELARAALVGSEAQYRRRWTELKLKAMEQGMEILANLTNSMVHAPYLVLGADDRLTATCRCGARPPAGVDADTWVTAHVAENRL